MRQHPPALVTVKEYTSMSIYTYKITHKISEALGIEPCEIPSLSDQELSKVPEDAKWEQGSMPILYGNTHAAGHIPWNKGKNCKGIIVGNKSAHLNGESTRFKKGLVPHNKGISLSEEAKQNIREKASQYCWINDGTSSKQHLKSHPVPEGWSRGRIMSWKRNMKMVSVC
jgi:hypothetical protein